MGRLVHVKWSAGSLARHLGAPLLASVALFAWMLTLEASTAAFTASTSSSSNSFTAGYWQLQALASGNDHSCVSLSSGLTKCWGKNGKGQLGDDTTSTPASPVTVVGPGGTGTLSEVEAVSGGKEFTCSHKSDGSAWCWGRNDQGQLGDNTTADSARPVQVVGVGGVGLLTGIESIGSGVEHTCAARSDGTVWCWGKNDKGQLGDGTSNTSQSPVQVLGVGGIGTLTGIKDVGVGSAHSCGVTAAGAAYCWGLNSDGQLGDNTTGDASSPVQVVGPGAVGTFSNGSSIAGGEKHSCASTTGRTAWCWGRNDKGQLGDNSTTDSTAPVQVTDNPGTGNLADVAGVTGGAKRSCAYLLSGDAWCWGENKDGSLGDGTTTDRLTPVQVVGPGGIGTLSDVRQLSTGQKDVAFTCAVTTADEVWCWGKNKDGVLGDGTTTDSLDPVQSLI